MQTNIISSFNKNTIMKATLNKIWILLSVIFTMSACGTDDMNFKDATVTAVQSLYEPANNKAVKLVSSASASLYFEWEAVRTEDSGAALYEVLFDEEGGDFSNPIYTITSDNNGYTNAATITHKIMNKVAAMAGIEPGSQGSVIWTVASSRGINKVLASESRVLTITSLNGFTDIPDEVFITGDGSETGTTLADAIPFKLTAQGEFEIYTKLESGKTYNFVDRTSGTPRVFYTEDNAVLKEDENGKITASKTAIYRISLDFNVSTITYTEITSLGVFFCPSNTVIWNLDYKGKGIWTGSGKIEFKQEDWGRDERYKFQMETVSNGSNVTEQLGTLNGTDSQPTASSDESYYYIKLLQEGSVNQWDNKWKFMSTLDGTTPTISVIMQGDKPYTHTIN